jgi:hypothetical protein
MTATLNDAVVAGALTVDPEPARRASGRRVAGALARIEGRRMLLHPAFVIGLIGSAYSLWHFRGGDMQQYWMLLGEAATTLGALTFLVGFLSASRMRRDDAEELYAALPVSPTTRTAGILLSLWAAAAAAAAMTAVAWLLVVGIDGRVLIELEPLEPGILEPAQVPLIVVAFGALGVCFGRWTPQTAAAPLLTLAIGTGPIAWSIPWVLMGTVPYLPRGHTWVVGSPGWHLVFLTGVIAIAAALALLRDRRWPAPWLLLAAGATAVSLGVAFQLA